MNPTQVILITVVNTIILTLITALGPSTNSLRTIPAKWRAVIVAGLSILSGALQMKLDKGATWDMAFMTALASGVGGLFKVLIEALDGTTDVSKAVRVAAKNVKAAARFGAASALCVLVGILLFGCAGSFEEAKVAGRQYRAANPPTTPPTQYCSDLDSKHALWSGVAAGAGALAGAQGIMSIPIDDKDIKVGLAAGTVAMGALAATAVVISDGAATAWARDCSGEVRP